MNVRDAKSLRAWARGAERGESCVYYRGDLAYERHAERDRINATLDTTVMAKIEPLALAAEQLAADGVINPVQRRRGENQFEYIAQRTRRPYRDRPFGRGDRVCNSIRGKGWKRSAPVEQ